jgi:hypothetical protein
MTQTGTGAPGKFVSFVRCRFGNEESGNHVYHNPEGMEYL